MRRLFFTNASQPEQALPLGRLRNIVGCFETIQRDPIRNYAGHRAKIGKGSGLRIRDAVEAHIGWDTIKTAGRIKASGKMQCRQHRHIDFSSSLPETAGVIMDQIECLAFASASAYEINDLVFMFNAPPLIIIWLCAGLAG